MVGLGRFGAGCGLVGLVILSGGLASPLHADSFYLENGQVIEGQIIKGTLNTLTVQTGSTVRLTSITQIERVILKMADGTELAGELLSWKDGTYEVRSADEVLRVADGKLLADEESVTVETATTPAPSESAAAEAPIETISMRRLPVFTLKNGDTLVGKILHATGSVLTIRPEGGSALPISRAQVEKLSFESDDGELISGKLIGWKDGVYRLQIDDHELLANLPDDAAKAPSPSTLAAILGTPEEPLDTPVIAKVEQVDAAVQPAAALEGLVRENENQLAEQTGVGGPANETAVAGLAAEGEHDIEAEAEAEPAAKGSVDPHVIHTQVEAVDENSGLVVFKFQLDKPAERPLVVLYAATDASAKAGEDFEAKSGVITFATGSAHAEVQVPIIDDEKGEDVEEFNLFLSGDPATIAFDERQIAVTINDND